MDSHLPSSNEKKLKETDAFFLAVKGGDHVVLETFLFYHQLAININQVRWSGFAALHKAAAQGFTDICEVLIEYGAEVNMRTTRGWYTPMHLAAGNGYFETAMLLFEKGANMKLPNKAGEDPFQYSSKRFKTETDAFKQKCLLMQMKRDTAALTKLQASKESRPSTGVNDTTRRRPSSTDTSTTVDTRPTTSQTSASTRPGTSTDSPPISAPAKPPLIRITTATSDTLEALVNADVDDSMSTTSKPRSKVGTERSERISTKSEKKGGDSESALKKAMAIRKKNTETITGGEAADGNSVATFSTLSTITTTTTKPVVVPMVATLPTAADTSDKKSVGESTIGSMKEASRRDSGSSDSGGGSARPDSQMSKRSVDEHGEEIQDLDLNKGGHLTFKKNAEILHSLQKMLSHHRENDHHNETSLGSDDQLFNEFLDAIPSDDDVIGKDDPMGSLAATPRVQRVSTPRSLSSLGSSLCDPFEKLKR